MGAEYYIFALFVFALALIVVFLVLKGTKKNKSFGEKMHEEREKRLMSLYFEVEDMLEEVKGYIEKSQESLNLQARKLEMDLRELMAQGMIPKETAASEKPEPVRQPEFEIKKIEKKENSKPSRESDLNEKVLKLYQDGMKVSAIAEKLKLAKGEILFILKLGGVSAS